VFALQSLTISRTIKEIFDAAKQIAIFYKTNGYTENIKGAKCASRPEF